MSDDESDGRVSTETTPNNITSGDKNLDLLD